MSHPERPPDPAASYFEWRQTRRRCDFCGASALVCDFPTAAPVECGTFPRAVIEAELARPEPERYLDLVGAVPAAAEQIALWDATAWGACADCAALVERRDLDRLVARVCQRQRQTHPERDWPHMVRFAGHVRALFTRFFAAWRGERTAWAEPATPAEGRDRCD